MAIDVITNMLILQLLLTRGAVVRTATSAADFFDSSAAAGAGGALFAKDLEIVRVVAIVSSGVDKVLEGSTTDAD